jgi:tetratricopeptide (TPR) repeat protein
MRVISLAVAISALLVGSAFAQDRPPPQCNANAQGVVDWQACLDASPANAAWRSLALMNLGTQAFLRDDFATAVRFYDEAAPPGQTLLSDVSFHAFRGAAYWHVGRRQEALADANIAYRMLHNDPTLPAIRGGYVPLGTDPEQIYIRILPILQTGDAQIFHRAEQEFRALPASDWVSYANRAGTFQEINDIPAALEMSGRALAMAPNEPAVLNNHCYILYTAHRAQEALPYCERAAATAPNVAAVHDSLSDVLVVLRRCAEAEREIAEARRLDPSDLDYAQQIVCTPR